MIWFKLLSIVIHEDTYSTWLYIAFTVGMIIVWYDFVYSN